MMVYLSNILVHYLFYVCFVLVEFDKNGCMLEESVEEKSSPKISRDKITPDKLPDDLGFTEVLEYNLF